MTNLTLESEYLIKLIKSAVNEEPVEPAPKGLDWQKLFDLSKSQQVYSIIAEVLDYNSVPADFSAEMKVYTQNELLRILAMKNEFQEIEKELNEKQIKYMLLKGSVLRSYYPKEKMRQMSDMDILFDVNKKYDVQSIMKRREYVLVSTGDHSDDYMKKPFYTFEFHLDLFDEDSDFNPDFSFVWKNAKQDENLKYKYNMSCSDLYLHTVCHMYKHYMLGGFGIRFLCDVYLILKKELKSLDKSYIDSKLFEFGIKDFEEEVKSLAVDIFESFELNSKQLEFLKTTMKFGVYGDNEYGVKLWFDDFAKEHQGEKHLLFKYYLKKTFPGLNFMRKTYKTLNKYPFLLPVFYVIRIFEKLRYKREYILNSYKVLKNAQNDKK